MWCALPVATLCATALAAAPPHAEWSARAIDARLPDRPAVALGPDGRRVLAYADARAVWVRAISRDGGLGAPRRVPGPRPSVAWAAAAVDARGAITVAWMAGALVLAHWAEGRPPAAGTPVSAAGSQVGGVVLATRARGGTIVAWSETRLPAAPDQLVAAALVEPGRPLLRTEVLTLGPGERPTDVFAASDAAGRPIVAAKTVSFFGRGPAALITADSAVTDGFSPQRAVRREPLDASELQDLHVLTDRHGAQLAVWLTGPFNGVRRIVAARRRPAARFAQPRTLASGRRIASVAAAMSASGAAAVAWTPMEGGASPLLMRALLRGQWWRPQRLTAPGRSAQQAELAFDGRGRATVVWASRHGIHARHWSGRRLGPDRAISAPWSRRLCWEPALTVGTRGDAVATFLCTRRGARPLHGLAHRPSV